MEDKYYLITLKAHSGGCCNWRAFDTKREVEKAMDELAIQYDYDHAHHYLVIKGSLVNIEMTKTHRLD